MEEITSALSSAQKAQLHQVADGLLEIYQTLVRMAYLDASWIARPPYQDVDSRLVPMWKSFKLDPAVIYLYSILPYVENSGDLGLDFFQGGQFADFRCQRDVAANRNPFYFPEEDSMPPTMTALSTMGNHEGVILYDSKRHRIGLFDQMGDWNNDYVVSEERRKRRDSGSGREQPKRYEDDADEGEYGELMKDGRDAGEVLRDMKKWYLELRETPGGGELTGNDWLKELVKPLYEKHGWPREDFDQDAFLADLVRARALRKVKYFAEEPLRKVECYKGWLAMPSYEDKEFEKLRAKIGEAKTVQEEWVARWGLYSKERNKRSNEKDLERAEEQVKAECPGGKCWKDEDLPVMELKHVATEYFYAQRRVRDREARLTAMKAHQAVPKQMLRQMEMQLGQAERQLAVVRKAYEACKAEVERLHPELSLSFLRVLGRFGVDVKSTLQRDIDTINDMESQAKELQEWLAQVPDEATEARQLIQEAIADFKKGTDFPRRSKDYYEGEMRKWEAEEGEYEGSSEIYELLRAIENLASY
ncbi:hypothetical protein QBC42DRAFT_325907 [Cladorrhinum samala]|uniref:Uncharacterized protein n=1 Tax=Cladorrhinum samala TaxID=585594 RepID=A0AAV9HS46_9PEZI|nr:hypothetical protein QBC42DRAFT_325907 [Cladorrhinum samala]